jgi:hypothetical protein
MKTNNCNSKIHVSKLPPIIKKLIDDKAAMQAYSRGEISKDALNKQGIKLVNPL